MGTSELKLDPASFDSKNYDRIAGVYQILAHIFSGGLIRKSKIAQLKFFKPASRVLYLGVGSGEEVIAAVRAGHTVTAIDISQKMIDSLAQKLMQKGLSAQLLTRDVLAVQPPDIGVFDAVCGNYFFNVFPKNEMPLVIDHTLQFVAEDGRLMTADMATQTGVLGFFAKSYLYFGLTFFVMLGFASFHPIYDYELEMKSKGWVLVRQIDHRWAVFLPALYRTSVFKRDA